MDLTRRKFVIMAATAAAAALVGRRFAEASSEAASQPAGPATASSEPAETIFDAGQLSDFPHAGVYSQFREQGLFVIRREKQLIVFSSVCTHKGCKVRSQDDGSFLCKCHGSRFDPDGHVTRGPALRDLPRLQVAQSKDGHVLVRKPG